MAGLLLAAAFALLRRAAGHPRIPRIPRLASLGYGDDWGHPAADVELYGKAFGSRGFRMNPELLRFNSTCYLVSALE